MPWLRGGTYGLVLFCSALVASGVCAPPSPPRCLLSAPSLGGWGHGVGAASPAALLLYPALPGPAAWGGTRCAPRGLLPLWPGQGGLPDHRSGRRRLQACGDLCCFPLLWRQAHRTLCEYREVSFYWCVCVYIFKCQPLCVCMHLAVGNWNWHGVDCIRASGRWDLAHSQILHCCALWEFVYVCVRSQALVCNLICRISCFPPTGGLIILYDILFTLHLPSSHSEGSQVHRGRVREKLLAEQW